MQWTSKSHFGSDSIVWPQEMVYETQRQGRKCETKTDQPTNRKKMNWWNKFSHYKSITFRNSLGAGAWWQGTSFPFRSFKKFPIPPSHSALAVQPESHRMHIYESPARRVIRFNQCPYLYRLIRKDNIYFVHFQDLFKCRVISRPSTLLHSMLFNASNAH